MPTICYTEKKFHPKTETLISMCNVIIEEYRAQGFDLTLRQLYYQLVSRDIIANKQTEYDRLGSIVNDARLAGMIDWDAIVDRTRNLRKLSHWDTPGDIIHSAAQGYNIDRWLGQTVRVEVWIEKDALVGVIEGVCEELDVPFFSCRGYTSQSEMWSASQRMIERYTDAEQETVIIHLGDHDPSGIDMTRDIGDRLALFCEYEDCPAPTIKRVALNSDQVTRYKPPPNPAKLTDSRATDYIRRHGANSWELDALSPAVIADLIRRNVMAEVNVAKYNARVETQKEGRTLLGKAAKQWNQLVPVLNNGGGK
jgi:hypothetical protein